MTTCHHDSIPIANALATLFAPHVEVVIHDIAADRIVHIAGNFSRRKVGDSSLTEIADLAPYNGQVIGPYRKANWDGRALKSISVVLRDNDNAPTGLMCINMDVSTFEAAQQALSAFVSMPRAEDAGAAELFPSDWREGLNQTIAEFLIPRGLPLERLTGDEKLALIQKLDQAGYFDIRNASNHIAETLRVSRAGLYQKLKASRERNSK